MYILADNALSFSKMRDMVRFDYNGELGEELEALVIEGIRLINYKTYVDVPYASYTSIINATIYMVSEQSCLIGAEGMITTRDFLQFLRTTKPTILKWKQWILNIAPEVGTLKLATESDTVQNEASHEGSRIENHEEALEETPQLLETFLALPNKPSSFKAFDQKVSDHLKTYDPVLKRPIKDKKKNLDVDFWFDHVTRRYLMDLHEWAITFILRKDWQKAYELTTNILSFSPFDGVGCRYIHVPLAVYLGHYDEAKALMSGYQDDSYSAKMNQALLLAVIEPKLALEQVKKALEANPYGVKILKVFNPHVDFKTLVSSYAVGSVEEAEMYAFETCNIWREVPKAWSVLELIQ